MNKRILAAALVLGTALTASASDQPNKPSGQTTTASQQGQIGLKTPFWFQVSGSYVFVINGGTSDWTGPVVVTLKCAPVAPATSCGSAFASGALVRKYAAGQFPSGHGKVPASAPTGNTVVITQGGGYDAIGMGLPIGTYKITASAANNTSEMTTTVTASPGGSPTPIIVNPGALHIAPTPTPAPRRP